MKYLATATVAGCLLGYFQYEPYPVVTLPAALLVGVPVAFFVLIFGMTLFIGRRTPGSALPHLGWAPGFIGGYNLGCAVAGALQSQFNAMNMAAPVLSLIVGASIIGGAALAMFRLGAAQPNNSYMDSSHK